MYRKIVILKITLTELILQGLKFLCRIENARGIQLSILNIHINVNTFIYSFEED